MQIQPTRFTPRTSWLQVGMFCSAMLLLGCSAEVNFSPSEGSTAIAITHFSFGKIVVDGRTFEDDIVIFADGTVRNWTAHISHVIQLVDIKALMNGPVTALIIGVGTDKKCSVSNEIKAYASKKKIKITILDTYEAVKQFNASEKAGLAACFHLTC